MIRSFVLAVGFQRGPLFMALFALAWLACSGAAWAQTALKFVEFAQPDNGAMLEADFVLPQADHVTSLEASVGGKALNKDKVKFTPADKVPNYRCAVLLLVDKTLGTTKDTNDKWKDKLMKSVRHTLGDIASVTGTAPYQFAVGTISAGTFDVLAPMGSEKSIVNSAIAKLPFNGTSPEIYLGTKRAIEWLAGTPAERKFLILISDGSSQDKVTTQPDVIQAAVAAKVHICTIGFPKAATPVVSVSSESFGPEPDDIHDIQRLGPLAEGTGGLALRADGTEPKLPGGAESNLVKLMVSGGKAEIDLKGMTAPVDLTCTVQTEFGKAYTFSHKVETIATLPLPQATPPPEAASKWATLQARLKHHPVLTICGGVALVVALLFLIALAVRLGKKPDADATLPLASDPVSLAATDDETVRMTEPAAPVAPPPPALAWLVILDADETRHPITKAAVRIGRKPDNDIVMKNNSVSSYHAEILKRGEQFVIADLHSSNKILVGGRLVERSPLADGDVIELGEVRLRFVLNNSIS